jgi:S1-C subfamily serine protease
MKDPQAEAEGVPESAAPRTAWPGRLRAGARSGLLFLAGVAAALFAVMLFNVLTPREPALTWREVNEAVAEAMASATPMPAYSALAYQAIRPSLVLIETQAQGPGGERGRGLGTGVVVDMGGSILTALHVVAGAEAIVLTFADGTQAEAQVVAAVPEKDIAVLAPAHLPGVVVPATLGNPHAMRVGDEAFAVGHPLGLYASLSAGVISGFDRSFTPRNGELALEDLIQIDAAVNPGNSGGPLLNRAGQVVGIVVALVNPTEQDVFVGIGFAVPIDVAGGAAGLPEY